MLLLTLTSVLLKFLLIHNLVDAEINKLEGVLFQDYNRYNFILTYLSNLAILYPEKVSINTIGLSYAGRPIQAVKISLNPNQDDNRPMILVDAGMHAREWMGPVVAQYLIYQLVQNTSNQYMIEDVDWIIIPVLNPDGYEFSHTHDRYWRKTICNTAVEYCSGVDINRNFDFHWMEVSTNKNECSQAYAGPRPFSEPETRALRAVALENRKNIKLYINLHSYASMIIFPWSYTNDLIYNYAEHKTLGEMVARAIEQVKGTKYAVGSTSELMYIVAGSSCDWMAGVARIPLNFGLELPKTEGDFQPPRWAIVPTAEETFEGFKTFHEYVQMKWTRNNNSAQYYN